MSETKNDACPSPSSSSSFSFFFLLSPMLSSFFFLRPSLLGNELDDWFERRNETKNDPFVRALKSFSVVHENRCKKCEEEKEEYCFHLPFSCCYCCSSSYCCDCYYYSLYYVWIRERGVKCCLFLFCIVEFAMITTLPP